MGVDEGADAGLGILGWVSEGVGWEVAMAFYGRVVGLVIDVDIGSGSGSGNGKMNKRL